MKQKLNPKRVAVPYDCLVLCGWLLLALSPTTRADENSKDPLVVAKWLAANKYKGWAYGSKASAEQVDCVQFVLAVIEELEDKTLAADARKRILISDIDAQTLKKDSYKIVRDSDPRITGVQKALVDLERGTAIKTADAKPGDLIQYWMKKDNGTWFGHSGVLNTITKDDKGILHATIFGAHGSGSTSDQACGVSKFELILTDSADRRIFLVRYKPAK